MIEPSDTPYAAALTEAGERMAEARTQLGDINARLARMAGADMPHLWEGDQA